MVAICLLPGRHHFFFLASWHHREEKRHLGHCLLQATQRHVRSQDKMVGKGWRNIAKNAYLVKKCIFVNKILLSLNFDKEKLIKMVDYWLGNV